MKKILLLCASLILAVTMSAQDKGYEKSVELSGSFGVNKYAKYAKPSSETSGVSVYPHTPTAP